ncbi:MAG: UDP-N-acetylglucosamine 2-epimerase [Putridiphycobacter sp.]|nr:UDP-N-acetylglucosamine 2-epimerase [Putridiphycobacter sp.]
MTIGLLTSSRADFGIYLPLAKALQLDPYFDLEIIAFGTHLSEEHGLTISEIEANELTVAHKIYSYQASNTPAELSKAIAHTSLKFADFWANHEFDLVLTLGDRYEMFAAVIAASPFNTVFAHIHAGETTLGAIDNAYRHSLSLFSKYLFTTTDSYTKRAKEIVEKDIEIYNVGALSIDNLTKIKYLTIEEMKNKFGFDLSQPTILSTFHPETVSFHKNKKHIEELLEAFKLLLLQYQIIVTMPNTDTMGQMIRDKIIQFKNENPSLIVVESLGMNGYLSCMKHCSFLLGNTSSGFVEATYFPKYVINLGKRQAGRIETENIITTTITTPEIIEAVRKIEASPKLENLNIYGNGDTASKIVSILKTL